MEKTAQKKFQENAPVLIVDKLGFLGSALSQKIIKEKPVVFLGNKRVAFKEDESQNFFNLNYSLEKKKIPSLPDFIYSTFIIIWNGEKEILENLSSFIRKAKNDKTRLIFLGSIFFVNEAIINKIKSLHSQATIIVYGDLFGGIIPLRFPTPVNQILYQAKNKQKIHLSNSGLGKIYPVFFGGTIEKILKIFNKNREGKTFFLFPKDPLTELSLAHLIHQTEPLVTIDFHENLESQVDLRPPKDGEFFEEGENLKEQVAKVLQRENNAHLDSLGLGYNGTIKKNETVVSKNPFFTSIFLIILILLLPLIATFSFSFLGFHFLASAKNMTEKGNFSTAYKNTNLAKRFFELGESSATFLLLEASFLGQKEKVQKSVEQIAIGREISLATSSLLKAFLSLKKPFLGTSLRPKEDFIEGLNDLKNANLIFQKIRSEKGNLKEGKEILTKIEDIEAPLRILINTSEVLPSLLGFEGEKKYLLLFQNNMELRPGGGFIGSYGLLTLKKGRMTSFRLDDIYDADGQLKGHLEPPFAIRRYLPSVHWYFRDSNFSLDFPRNASQAAFFLKEEMGETVDGVIAIDVLFIKKILEVLGPVYVTDYKETVTSENLYLLTQTYSEKDSFPGSSQKKDFLRSLYHSLQVKLSTGKQIPYEKLLKAIFDAASEKHLLLASPDPSIQNLLTINNLSSTIWDERQEQENVINDFISLSEANLGVNKVNYFVKRKIDHEVFIEKEGKVIGETTVAYKNTSQKGEWPGGDYKNYLRFVLPLGSSLTKVEIDDTLQKITPAVTDFLLYETKGFLPPRELEVEKSTESGKTTYGFLVIVPTEVLKTVSITYELPQRVIVEKDSFIYNLMVFKQPGTEDDLSTLIINYPENFKAIKLPEEFKNETQKITYSSILKTDQQFEISFSQK